MADKPITGYRLDNFIQVAEQTHAILLDTRSAEEFSLGFLPNSIFVNLEAIETPLLLSLIPANTPILVIAQASHALKNLEKLTAQGYQNLMGYLADDLSASIHDSFKKDMVIEVETDELAMDIPFDDQLIILDIRNGEAYSNLHIKQSINIPMAQLSDPGSMADLEEQFNIYLVGNHSDESLTACSLLKKQGIHNVRNVQGGWNGILGMKEKFSLEKEKKPTKPSNN